MPRSTPLRAAFAVLALACLCAPAARASVLIDVDKSTQSMTVSVDGVPRYHFNVSTGRAGYGTPNGTFHPQRLERSWFSKQYYNSPMPHSIFFHRGYAIHGSYDINHLGGPASHGCVRLHPKNAATLFALVKRQGMGATTIRVSGQNPSSMRARPAPRQRDDLGPQPDYYDRGYAPYRERPYEDDRWNGGGGFPFFPYERY
jgi:hypothetical protein